MAQLSGLIRGLILVAALAPLSCGRTKDGRHVSVVVRNAGGVRAGTPVEVAGVPVGEVEDIRLQQWTARLLLRVDRAVDLREDCSVRIDTRGLVGDKVLTVLQGAGAPVAERAELRSVELDMSADMAQVLERVSTAMADMQAVTKVVRRAVDKDGVAGLRPMLCDGTTRPSASGP
jgi:phospholipid/cholesterol/gamma-HCH transport system substrate-binding protein